MKMKKFDVSVSDGIVRVKTKKKLVCIVYRDEYLDETCFLTSIEYYTPRIVKELEVEFRGEKIPAYLIATGTAYDSYFLLCIKVEYISKSGETKLYYGGLSRCGIHIEDPLLVRIEKGAGCDMGCVDIVKSALLERLLSSGREDLHKALSEDDSLYRLKVI